MHGDRDDQQHQYRCLGQRLVGDAIEQRSERGDDRDREQYLERKRERQRRQQVNERGNRQRHDQIDRQPARQPAPVSIARRRVDLHRAGEAGQSDQQTDGSRRLAELQRSQRQRSVGHELAGRNEDDPRYREYQHQRQRKQRVDRAVGDAVLRQQHCDREVHRISVASAARRKQKAGCERSAAGPVNVSSFAQDPLAVLDLDDDAGAIVHAVVVGRRSC